MMKKNCEKGMEVFKKKTLIPSEVASGDLLIFFDEMHPKLKQIIESDLMENRAIKWYVICRVNFIRTNVDGEEETTTGHFRNLCERELGNYEDVIESHISQAFRKVRSSFDEFIERGSGWRMNFVESMDKFTVL